MKKIIFGTTNENKLSEARSILGEKVEGVALEADEVQSLDNREVAVKKAIAYYKQTKKPLFVEDVSLCIDALNGLPGTYIDAFVKTLGPSGIANLLKNKNKKAKAITTIVYIWGKDRFKIFEGVVEGKISDKPRGKGFGWDPIFIPNKQNKTFAEMQLSEKNNYSMRSRALNKLAEFLGFHKSN